MAPRQSRPPRSPEQPPSAPLPAPYEAPWLRLGADLQAVLAAAGLKLRELARLNGEGRLRRPGFWPAELAPLFWPLALALGAALLVGLLVAGQVALARRQPAPVGSTAASSSLEKRAGEASQTVAPGSSQTERSAPERRAGEASEDARASEGDRAAEGTESFEGFQAPESTEASEPARTRQRAKSAAQAQTEANAKAPQVAPAPPAELESPLSSAPADPLAELRRELLGPEPPPWVLRIQEQPAESLLQLRLGPDFAGLPEPQRQALAEQWLERARQRGYERLELLDPGGVVLARPARVGSGMILLNSLPPSP